MLEKSLPWPGEEHAGRLLAERDPRAVERAAGVAFDPVSAAYSVRCFGQVVTVSLKGRSISSRSRTGKVLFEELGGYLRLSLLRYLVDAREIEPSGQLVRPSDLPGGQIFVQGTHVLPLDEVARRFSDDLEAFLKRGRELGGARLSYGDASVELHPFTRFPLVLIVWSRYEDFPAHASLLLDAACAPFPTDAIWATAKMAVELMLTTA